jgi:hypothetical protein
MMNRRSFIRCAATGGIVLALAPASLLTGCSVNGLSVAKAFIASAQAIVTADPSASYVADLDLAIASMQTAVRNWNGSSASCALTSSANTVAQIIDSIEPGSPVALLATVAVAGFDVLMAKLAPCTTPALTANVAGAHTASLHRGTLAYTATQKKLSAAFFPVHAYRGAFNQAAKTSGLAVRI